VPAKLTPEERAARAAKRAAYSREWAAANRGKRSAYSRAWNAKNKDKKDALGRAWREANRDRIRDRVLRKRYNMTLGQHDALLASQGGRCAVCSADEPGGAGAWHVDHDHSTGEVRGLLCALCNVGLGMFKDNVDIMQRAVAYLAASRG
jgi:hypothetical protein